MITLVKLADDMKRMLGGGISTVDSKFNNLPYLYDLINQARAVVIRNDFIKTRRPHPAWIQSFTLEYDASLQESDCFVKFMCPNIIAMEARQDGFIYIGQTDGNCSYKRILTRGELSNYNKHRHTDSRVRVLYADGILEVYGNQMLKELRVDAVFSNPTDVPTYNINVDLYPIDENNLIMLKQYLYQSQLEIEQKTPADIKQDNKDLTEVSK